VVYAASGVGPYAFTFEILSQTDIAVYKGSTLLTLTTDYTVTINANGTGSVTLVATAGTSNITIVGAKNIQRTSDFTTGGDLFANTLNDELDNQTIYVQQVAETAERGLKAPVTDPTDIAMTLPAKDGRKGKVLAFDSTTGNPVAGPALDAVVTVIEQSANINTVAANIGSVNTVAGNTSNINTVAGVSSGVTTVATNIANVNAVGADLLEGTSEINTVAVDIANVNTVGNNISNVNTVGGISADVTSVAGNSSNINTVAGVSGNVTTVAGISGNVTTVAGVSANVTTVAGISSAVSTVATNNANVSTVATNIASVNTNATNIVAIQNASTNATNAANSATAAGNAQVAAEAARDATLTAYDNFDDRYLGSKTSNPTLDNDGNALVAGSLYFNSVSGEMRVYTGSAWVAAYVSGTGFLSSANNLSDVASVSTARTNLGLAIGTDVLAPSGSGASLTSLNASNISSGTLSNDRLNTVSVAKGGTGATTLTANNVLLGNGTSALQVVAPGTAGNVLTSNGTTWSSTTPASGGFSGATTTSSATDITLTNTSTQTQYVTMTAVDKFVILPDATTLATKGSPIFVIINTGQYSFHIKDNGGNIIYYNVLANQTLTLTLIDNSVAIGKWANKDGLLQLSVGLPQISSITSIYSGSKEPSVAMLSATEALIFFQPAATSLSVVLATISGTSVSYGTPVSVIASGADPSYVKALAFNSTTGIVSYRTSTGPNWVLRAVTVSGSTVTVGAASNLTSNNGQDIGSSGFMAMLDSTTGFVGYVTTTPSTFARAFTVSGTTITLGTAVTVIADWNEFYGATQIASGKVLFAYNDGNGGFQKIRACTNSGTTLTLGTAVSATDGVLGASIYNNLQKISTDAAAGTQSSLSTGGVTVSGTTIGTQNTALIGDGTAQASNKNKYLSDGLQLAVGQVATGYFAYLFKGNSSVGITSIPIQKLGIPVPGTVSAIPLDVNGGNKGITVSALNGFVASQIIGVL
jgi:hypothetical protein